jgi:hypothetical protein
MQQIIWGSTFPEAELTADNILRTIEILEDQQLTPGLDFDLAGPIEEFETNPEKTNFVKIADRKSWIQQQFNNGKDALLYTDSDYRVIAPNFMTQYVVTTKGQKEKTMGFNLTTKISFRLEDLYEAIREISSILKLYWCDISPWKVRGYCVKQIVRPHEKNRKPPFGLPIVKVPQFLSGPEVPYFFGWVNYWSPATVGIIGFDEVKDSGIFYKAERTKNGGIILQLTESELDLENPEHLKVLKSVYERFPKVGGRDTSFDYLK